MTYLIGRNSRGQLYIGLDALENAGDWDGTFIVINKEFFEFLLKTFKQKKLSKHYLSTARWFIIDE